MLIELEDFASDQAFGSLPPLDAGGGFGGFGLPGGDAVSGFGGDLPSGEAQGSTDLYDQGYRAGWDDAERRLEGEHKRVSAALERAIEDLSFSMQDARRHAIRGLSGLVAEIARTLLPAMGRAATHDWLAGEVARLAEEAPETRVILFCAAEEAPLMQGLLAEIGNPEVTLQTDAALLQGQLILHSDADEHLFDLTDALRGINDALQIPLAPLGKTTLNFGT